GGGRAPLGRGGGASVPGPAEGPRRGPPAEPRGRHAETGVPGRVGEVAFHPEEHREARAGVARAGPAGGASRSLELREGVEEVLGERREGRVVLVVARADRPTEP